MQSLRLIQGNDITNFNTQVEGFFLIIKMKTSFQKMLNYRKMFFLMTKLPIISKTQIRPSCYRLYSQHQHGKWHIIDISSIFVEKREAGK